MEQAREKLLKEIEKAKERVHKRQEIVEAQNAQMNEQQASTDAMVKDAMSGVKPPVPKDEQVQRGKQVIEDLDKMAEAVYWNNPKDYVASATENNKNVPKFADGRATDGKKEGKPEYEENAKNIKSSYQEFSDAGKAAFVDPNNEDLKKAAMDKYKAERKAVEQALNDLGVPESDIPEAVEFDEATEVEGGDEDEIALRDEEARKAIPVDEIAKLQQLYSNCEGMKYGIEKGDNNTFVTNAKPVLSDAPQVGKKLEAEGTKTKDPKKKKIGQNITKDYQAAVIDGKASIANKGNEDAKKRAVESIEKLQGDIVDALAANGISKKGAEKALKETKRDDQAVLHWFN